MLLMTVMKMQPALMMRWERITVTAMKDMLEMAASVKMVVTALDTNLSDFCILEVLPELEDVSSNMAVKNGSIATFHCTGSSAVGDVIT